MRTYDPLTIDKFILDKQEPINDYIVQMGYET